jgi:hypothetical protein
MWHGQLEKRRRGGILREVLKQTRTNKEPRARHMLLDEHVNAAVNARSE